MKTQTMRVVGDQSADTLGNIVHRIESETAKLDSLQKLLWYFAHGMGEHEESPMLFSLGNSIEAIKSEIDGAIKDLMRFPADLQVRP